MVDIIKKEVSVHVRPVPCMLFRTGGYPTEFCRFSQGHRSLLCGALLTGGKPIPEGYGFLREIHQVLRESLEGVDLSRIYCGNNAVSLPTL